MNLTFSTSCFRGYIPHRSSKHQRIPGLPTDTRRLLGVAARNCLTSRLEGHQVLQRCRCAPPVITMFLGGMFTIPWWFMTVFPTLFQAYLLLLFLMYVHVLVSVYLFFVCILHALCIPVLHPTAQPLSHQVGPCCRNNPLPPPGPVALTSGSNGSQL